MKFVKKEGRVWHPTDRLHMLSQLSTETKLEILGKYASGMPQPNKNFPKGMRESNEKKILSRYRILHPEMISMFQSYGLDLEDENISMPSQNDEMPDNFLATLQRLHKIASFAEECGGLEQLEAGLEMIRQLK